jgi:hypothetical protein
MTRRDLTAVAVAALLLSVRPFTAGSMSIALLFDVTFSVTSERVDPGGPYAKAIHAVTNQFQPGDSAIIGVTTSRVTFGPANRTSATDLIADWRRLLAFPASERFGPSPLFDALDATVSRVRHLPGKRAVVLWTDGRPTGNVLGAEEVGARAADTGVSLNVIVDETPWVQDPKHDRLGIDRCQVFADMTRATGGICVLNPHPASAPVKQLEQILQQLRNR